MINNNNYVSQYASFSSALYIPDFHTSRDISKLEIPPYTNRGGLNYNVTFSKPCILPPPTKTQINCIVDYLSFTFKTRGFVACKFLNISDWRNDLNINERETIQTDEEAEIIAFLLLLAEFIPDLHFISGDKGMFGYKKTLSLYRDTQKAGVCAFKGNKDTCFVSLTGMGCSGVDMYKMRLLLEKLPFCKITRVDLAHDDLHGKLKLSDFRRWYADGRFHTKGCAPSSREIINSDKGTGDTFYVGKKENGKEACIYEKGKQQGDKHSKWLRVEGRLTSVDRVIPFETLTSPAVFLSGMYPCFEFISAWHERVQVVKQQSVITLEKYVEYAKTSYGQGVNLLLELGKTPEEIVSMLVRDGIPKRFQEIPFV